MNNIYQSRNYLAVIVICAITLVSCDNKNASTKSLEPVGKTIDNPRTKYLEFKNYCITSFHDSKHMTDGKSNYYDDLFLFLNTLCSERKFMVLTEHGVVEILGEPEEKQKMKEEVYWYYKVKRDDDSYSNLILIFKNGILESTGSAPAPIFPRAEK
jgi:hypothetical protein